MKFDSIYIKFCVCVEIKIPVVSYKASFHRSSHIFMCMFIMTTHITVNRKLHVVFHLDDEILLDDARVGGTAVEFFDLVEYMQCVCRIQNDKTYVTMIL